MTEQLGFDWDAQRQRSQEQRSLLAAVRRRDGDQCRVCGRVVKTDTRRSALALAYRILDPGTTLTLAGVVLVCREHAVEGDVVAAPRHPVYSEATLTWLNEQDAAAAPVVETEAAGDDERLARVRASNQDRKYRRYWVEVSGDTAMELDCLGLIVRHLDKTGKPTIFPITRTPSSDPGRALSMVAGRLRRGLSSPHLAGAPRFELSGDDVVGDMRGSHFTITSDDLIGRIIPSVIDALRMSDPAFPGDVELNYTANVAAVDREDDLVMDEQPSVDNSLQGIDDGVLAKNGGVPVNSQPSHNSSPSVGAPTSAVRDNSNPTEGDRNNQGRAS